MSTWLPLESNPDVMTKYIYKLGVSNKWQLTDVMGLDAEMLAFLPQPVKAIILLFPVSEKYENHRKEEKERLDANPEEYPNNLFYMRQLTSNACGTVALIHSLANNIDIELENGVLKSFLDNAINLSPEERGRALENDVSFTQGHEELAREGQTVADPQEKVNHHFVTFINFEGNLYELDGRKSSPIKHGSTCAESFVEDAAKVCKEFMARDPNELRFTVLALVAAPQN